MYTRASASDYDDFQAKGWKTEELLPLMRKHETYQRASQNRYDETGEKRTRDTWQDMTNSAQRTPRIRGADQGFLWKLVRVLSSAQCVGVVLV